MSKVRVHRRPVQTLEHAASAMTFAPVHAASRTMVTVDITITTMTTKTTTTILPTRTQITRTARRVRGTAVRAGSDPNGQIAAARPRP